MGIARATIKERRRGVANPTPIIEQKCGNCSSGRGLQGPGSWLDLLTGAASYLVIAIPRQRSGGFPGSSRVGDKAAWSGAITGGTAWTRSTIAVSVWRGADHDRERLIHHSRRPPNWLALPSKLIWRRFPLHPPRAKIFAKRGRKEGPMRPFLTGFAIVVKSCDCRRERAAGVLDGQHARR